MNPTLTGSEERLERYGPPPRKGFGCLIKSIIGIAVFAVVMVVAVWLIIMHSSLPLRFVTKIIEQGGEESNLKITGVSGSLSSGLSFKNVTWDDGEITDMRFRYSGIMDVILRNQLIIHEMHVGSATVTTRFFQDTPEETESAKDSSTDIESADDSLPAERSTEPLLRLLQIDRVSLNQIIIKNATTGDTITIPKIEWTGFKAEKGGKIELGNLDADSDHLVIKTSTPPSSDYYKRFEITLMPKMHSLIIKPVRIDAYLGEKDNKPLFDITAFDNSVALTVGSDGTQQLLAKGVDLADFLDAPLPNQFRLDATFIKTNTTDSTLTVRSGSFLLGTKSFEIQPTTVTGPEDKPEGTVFLALHREGDSEIRYEIPTNKTEDREQSFTPALTSTPAMTPEDLTALLFHDKDFTALAPADQKKLRKHMTWFSFLK